MTFDLTEFVASFSCEYIEGEELDEFINVT